MTYIFASVSIPINESLDDFAARLSRLAPGFKFEEDLEGRYDEVPAFEAEHKGMKFTLLGVPPDEEFYEYELKFRSETDLPLPGFLKLDESGFIRRFVHEKQVNKHGLVDYSRELAQLLTECGISGCQPNVRAPS